MASGTYQGPLPPWQAPQSFPSAMDQIVANYSGLIAQASAPLSIVDGAGCFCAMAFVGPTSPGSAILYDLAGPATAPTTADEGTAGLLNGTAYQWYVEFLNVSGVAISAIGVKSTSLNLTNKKALVTNIPTGPAGTVARRLFRNKSAGSTWYVLTIINDNITTQYTDNTADASLTAAYASVLTDGRKIFKASALVANTYQQSTFDRPINFNYGIYAEIAGANNELFVYWLTR